MRDIEGRMQTLGSSDVCALFLLSVESREADEALDLDEGADRAASLLARFFRLFVKCWGKGPGRAESSP